MTSVVTFRDIAVGCCSQAAAAAVVLCFAVSQVVAGCVEIGSLAEVVWADIVAAVQGFASRFGFGFVDYVVVAVNVALY